MTATATSRVRGIRNNNPGNLEWGDPWQGLVSQNERTDPRFCQFVSPAYGIRAIARTLITYQDRRKARDGSRIDTVREIIERWAPAHENNVDSYTTAVRRAVFGDPSAPVQYLDVHDYDTLRSLVEAIIRHENGVGPLKTANTWYDNDTIDEGLRLAGVRPRVASKAGVPVTPEAVGATATGAIGAGQVAEALPPVVQAIESADGHLSSGSIVRLVLGVVLIGIAVFVAYTQIKRHKSGQL